MNKSKQQFRKNTNKITTKARKSEDKGQISAGMGDELFGSKERKIIMRSSIGAATHSLPRARRPLLGWFLSEIRGIC
jgi:hypothetical protein